MCGDVFEECLKYEKKSADSVEAFMSFKTFDLQQCE